MTCLAPHAGVLSFILFEAGFSFASLPEHLLPGYVHIISGFFTPRAWVPCLQIWLHTADGTSCVAGVNCRPVIDQYICVSLLIVQTIHHLAHQGRIPTSMFTIFFPPISVSFQFLWYKIFTKIVSVAPLQRKTCLVGFTFHRSALTSLFTLKEY